LKTVPVPHLIKNSGAFDGTRLLITVLTQAHHWYLSFFRWIQPMSFHSVF